MKRNRLYTANKWNKPLFALDIDRTRQNLYDGFFGSSSNLNSSSGYNTYNNLGSYIQGNSNGVNLATMNNGMNFSLGSNYNIPLSTPSINRPINWSNPISKAEALNNTKQTVDNFQTNANKNNPLYNPNASEKSGWSENLKLGLGAASDLASTIKIGSNSKRGLYDDLDPLYHAAGVENLR